MHYDLDTLDDYLRGELDTARDAEVHAHLETCEPCGRAYDEAATVRDWIRTAAAAEELAFPSMIKARVWEEIRSAPPSRFAWLRTGWRPWLALPVAAALALFAYVEIPAVHGGAPAGIAASDLLIEHSAQMADNPLADHGLVVRASTLDAGSSTVPLVEAVDSTSVADPSGDGR
jgi:anti-sigma factor RsiW